MDLHVNGTRIRVTLSRRNLLALLTKLDWPVSARTIERDFGDFVLAVTAEEDADHYRDRSPGPMHPQTERDIRPKTGRE